ncbi:MAG: trypsin-like peptidase domain-containing protein [Candidatus Nitrosopolaris sp.]
MEFKTKNSLAVLFEDKYPIVKGHSLIAPIRYVDSCGEQGHIVTNDHVVGDTKVVDVTFVNGNRYTAKVIASDIYSDIAVLQISQNTSQPQQQRLLSSLKPLVLGNSSDIQVGDTRYRQSFWSK